MKKKTFVEELQYNFLEKRIKPSRYLVDHLYFLLQGITLNLRDTCAVPLHIERIVLDRYREYNRCSVLAWYGRDHNADDFDFVECIAIRRAYLTFADQFWYLSEPILHVRESGLPEKIEFLFVPKEQLRLITPTAKEDYYDTKA